MGLYKRYIKRTLDFIGALFLTLLMLPVFALIWVLIRIFMGAPVVIVQNRVGLNGKVFKLYKFRTMLVAKDKNGKLLPDAKRITKLGAFLRKSSLDEILQFINILKGDMSFIGPRPFMDFEINALSEEANQKRNSVLPGMSGLAQVSGRNELTLDKKLQKDFEYIDNMSFCLDLKIFFKTLLTVLFCVSSTPLNKNTVENYIKNKK